MDVNLKIIGIEKILEEYSTKNGLLYKCQICNFTLFNKYWVELFPRTDPGATRNGYGKPIICNIEQEKLNSIIVLSRKKKINLLNDEDIL